MLTSLKQLNNETELSLKIVLWEKLSILQVLATAILYLNFTSKNN